MINSLVLESGFLELIALLQDIIDKKRGEIDVQVVPVFDIIIVFFLGTSQMSTFLAIC